MGSRPRERRATRRALFALPLGLALVFLSGAASSAEGPTIQAVTTAGPYGSSYWSPSSAQTTAGGTVTFTSPSATTPHGVTWSGGPATPACSNVPINDFKTSWTGTCSFAQAGDYSFYCPAHPSEMKGTITASSAGGGGGSPDPGTQPPKPTEPSGSPLQGPLAEALRLAKSQRGTAVRGSVGLSSAAAGGKLEVDLLMARALLADSGRVGPVRVGHLVRRGLRAGRTHFAVSLKPAARLALRERGRLSLKVRLSITPPGGKALILNRSVAVHG
jgi:plastocyanin